MKTVQTLTVNDREIQIASDGQEKYVGIRPICEAIGVNYTTQLDKIMNDEILSSVVPLRGITGADGKAYKMRVMPLRFVFGWIFTINPKNVKPEVREQIIAYKMECYNALYDSFTKRIAILKERTDLQVKIKQLEKDLKEDPKYKQIQELKSSVKMASQQLNSMDKTVIDEQLNLFSESETSENKDDSEE